MNLKGFIGGAYKLDAVNIDAQRCINLYPEVIESGNGKEGEVAYLKSTDGLLNLVTAGAGPIRCVSINSAGNIYVASGNKLYIIENNAGVWSASIPIFNIGVPGQEFETTSGPIIAAVSDPSEDVLITVFVDGTNSYLFLIDSGVEYFGTFAAYGYPPVLNASHVVFIGGYFVFNEIGTNRFYVSQYNSFNVDPLDFASAEGDPDRIMGLIALNNDLWIFNETSVEIWSLSGNGDLPFSRVQGGFFETGCLARYSIAKASGMVYWLDDNGVVQTANGPSPKRISTHAIEQAIAGYSDKADAVGYCYEKDGHVFYVLNFSEATWVYDASTGLWHERSFTDDEGNIERHRGAFVGRSLENDKIIVGDYENGNVYAYDSNTYTDDENVITRLRSSPHLASEGKNIIHKCLTLFMSVGVGLDGDAPTEDADPHIMLRHSNDGGNSWSNEIMKSIGKIGEFSKRVKFWRLGASRDRVYEVKYTGKTKFNLTGADIEVEQGNS